MTNTALHPAMGGRIDRLAGLLAEQLNERLDVWTDLVGSEVLAAVRARIDLLAPTWARQFVERTYDPVGAQETGAGIVNVLFDGDPPADWWTSDVGWATGIWPTGQSWTASATARALGLTEGTIESLLVQGRLKRSETPGVGVVDAGSAMAYERRRRTLRMAGDRRVSA
jgi:hypothetical protein